MYPGLFALLILVNPIIVPWWAQGEDSENMLVLGVICCRTNWHSRFAPSVLLLPSRSNDVQRRSTHWISKVAILPGVGCCGAGDTLSTGYIHFWHSLSDPVPPISSPRQGVNHTDIVMNTQGMNLILNLCDAAVNKGTAYIQHNPRAHGPAEPHA